VVDQELLLLTEQFGIKECAVFYLNCFVPVALFW